MADPWRFSVSVSGAVINDRGELLAIQRRDNGHWEPPGGLVEPGESLYETLVREVLEETGIHVQPVRLSGVYQNMKRDIVALVFRCHPKGGTTRTSSESRYVRWFAPEVVRELMDEAYAARLLDALQAEPVVRQHDGVSIVHGFPEN